MDRFERMELRKMRLQRLGKWKEGQQPTPSPQYANPTQKFSSSQANVINSNPNPNKSNKKCGCSRSKG